MNLDISLDTTKLKHRFTIYEQNIASFKSKLDRLIDLSTKLASKNQQAISQKLKQIENNLQSSISEHNRTITQFLSNLVSQFNQTLQASADLINVNICDDLSLALETICIFGGPAKHLIHHEPQQKIWKIESRLQTLHLKKYYENRFSPTEVSIQCLAVNRYHLVSGGWDGGITVYSCQDNSLIEYVNVSDDHPIESVSILGNFIFVKVVDALSLYVISQNIVTKYMSLQIPSPYVITTNNILNMKFVYIEDGRLKLRSLVEDTSEQLDLEQIKSINRYGENRVLVQSNISAAILDLAHKSPVFIEIINGSLLKNIHVMEHWILSQDHFQLSLYQLKKNCLVFHHHIRLSEFACQHGLYEISHQTIVEIKQITIEQQFEFGATCVVRGNSKIYAAGKDNRRHIAVYNVL